MLEFRRAVAGMTFQHRDDQVARLGRRNDVVDQRPLGGELAVAFVQHLLH